MIGDDINLLDVDPYDEVTVELWEAMQAAQRARSIVAGHGARCDYHPNNTVVHFDPPPQTWPHPWKPSLVGDGVRLRSGLVVGVEPAIGGVPLSGDDRRPAPVLRLDLGRYDAEGRSWIALRAVRAGDSDDALDKLDPKQLTVVQVSEIPGLASGASLDVGGVALHPLALLKRAPSERKEVGKAWPIAMFHLGHRYDPLSKRHFFPAAA